MWPMPLISIPAHFDGKQVVLDEKVTIPANSRLILTVLEAADADRETFLAASAQALNAAYSNDEVEYSEDDLLQ